jgi:deazaflavin-dependent oxidoreductase (nitroreductase family)
MLERNQPPIRPLVGPALGRPALSGPWPVLEATYIGGRREGSDMGRKVLIVLAVLFLALSAIAIVYVLGIRSGSSTVRNAARRFHHTVGNRVQMRSAGMPGTFASVIRHQGRRTGNTYETPVWAVPTEDGFVIAIVYGSRSDWLKNVMASGAAAIVHKGETYPVNQPEVLPMETARAYFPATLQRIHRRIRVDRCLRVRRVKVETTAAV